MNPLLEATPEGAKGRVYAVIIALGENRQPSSVVTGGHFEDSYVKTQQGWRFKRRQFIPQRRRTDNQRRQAHAGR
jgi:hypothetical protein